MTPSVLMLLSTLTQPSPSYDWKHLFYTVNGSEVMLWETTGSQTCILGTGPREVVDRLDSESIRGEANMLVEVLPAPKPLGPVKDGFVLDYTVRVRGVPVQPQCDQSKGLYWIRDFRFIRSTIPSP